MFTAYYRTSKALYTISVYTNMLSPVHEIQLLFLFLSSPITRSSQNSTSPFFIHPRLHAVHEIRLPHYYPSPTDCAQFTKFNFPTITRPLLTAHSSQNSTSSFFVPPRLHAVHEIQLLPFSFLPNYTQFTKFNCLFALPGIWLIVSSQYQDKCTGRR